ncbi:MAG: apolipoprotein N-acyltransferase [Chitinispirillaceae bacterium]|nr:apolipoprotein N-acyltransferase [Chitinispirillaceae bacterium]
MLQIKLRELIDFYHSHNRWWVPLATGLLFSLLLLPFNHEFHWTLSLYPLFSLFGMVPLFFFAKKQPLRRAVLYTYLFSLPVAFGQCFWLVFVKIEGLWLLIIAAMLLLGAYLALFFLLVGMLFRWCHNTLPKLFPLVFPAFWVVIDYLRSLGEISFPWGFLGYTFTPILPLSQLGAVTGVWGLTYLVVFGNMLAVKWGTVISRDRDARSITLQSIAYVAVLAVIVLWGWQRIHRWKPSHPVKVALLQTAIDQLHWGNNSLEGAFDVTESMVYDAAEKRPELIIGPESAFLCYLSRQSGYRRRVAGWVDSTGIPLIVGALHWDRAAEGSIYDYLVYNTAFLFRPNGKEPVPYRKIKLVPFSEAFPFEGIFPILSRVNLGEADFKRGTESTVYTVNDSFKVAPFICYESIYPGYVKKRMHPQVGCIVHITNDGWFGRSTGPYQHATMARMRSIEHGCSLARSAITGISMLVDPVGRVSGKTRLGERTILSGTVYSDRIGTIYNKYGDWFVMLCIIIVAGSIAGAVVIKFRR